MSYGERFDLTVGIIGGGQLARMMIYRARKLGFRFAVLEKDPDCPAAPLTDRFVPGTLYSKDDLKSFVRSCDIVTYDIEHIDTEALIDLEDEGCTIRPSPRVLDMIQDKGAQKRKLAGAGIPVPRFFQAENADEIRKSAQTYPYVQKARFGGYDGRGVAVIRNAGDEAGLIQAPSLIEEYIDLEKELAVMVALDTEGGAVTYPVTEMTFDSVHQICTRVAAPAAVPPAVARDATEIAEAAARAFGSPGIYGIELFWAKDGPILVNEVAPRPHNSGHCTMEACITDQFEQHIRAVTGMPLGSPALVLPAVMVNLLGSPGFYGKPVVRGLREALEVPGFSVHLYGKSETRPYRKMGHFTVTGSLPVEALEKADRLQKILRIEGEEYKNE